MMAPRPYQYCYRCGGAAPAACVALGLQCCCRPSRRLSAHSIVSRQHLGANSCPCLPYERRVTELQPGEPRRKCVASALQCASLDFFQARALAHTSAYQQRRSALKLLLEAADERCTKTAAAVRRAGSISKPTSTSSLTAARDAADAR